MHPNLCAVYAVHMLYSALFSTQLQTFNFFRDKILIFKVSTPIFNPRASKSRNPHILGESLIFKHISEHLQSLIDRYLCQILFFIDKAPKLHENTREPQYCTLPFLISLSRLIMVLQMTVLSETVFVLVIHRAC